MTRFVSEALAKHNRNAFSSGHERIDQYFHETVPRDCKRDYAARYVGPPEEDQTHCGAMDLGQF